MLFDVDNPGKDVRSDGYTKAIQISDWVREISKEVVPSRGKVSDVTDTLGRGLISRFTDKLKQTLLKHDTFYLRNIAYERLVPANEVTDLYIQFPGAGARADSQAPLMKDISEQAEKDGRHVMGVSVESVANPEARGRIAFSSLERAMVNADLILQQIESLPNVQRIHLSFRSISALEAAQTTLIVNEALERRKNRRIESPNLPEVAKPEVESVLLFQAAGVMKESIGEFFAGVGIMGKKEHEIRQAFPSIEDFYRVLEVKKVAEEKGSEEEIARCNQMIEQMDMLNPIFKLIIFEEKKREIEYKILDKSKEQRPLENGAALESLQQQLDEMNTQIEVQQDALSSNIVLNAINEQDPMKRTNLEMYDREMWKAWKALLSDPKNKNLIQIFEELKEHRREFLFPLVDKLLAGMTDRADHRPDSKALQEKLRTLYTILPHMNVIRRMPDVLRKKLQETRIPTFYIFGDRDEVFPADKAWNDMELSLKEQSREKFVVLFGNQSHSTLSPFRGKMAQALESIMKLASQMKKNEDASQTKIQINTLGLAE